MDQVNAFRESLPDVARDVKINLQNVLQPAALNAAQVWGTAIACAYAAKSPKLAALLTADAKAAGVEDGTIDDAKAAAIVMGMNNVYYRFRHAIGKQTYSERPARLRMMRLTQVTSNKPDFDLFCFAVSAVNFCESCMKSHENEVIEAGMTEDQVHDAARIASVVQSAAVAMSMV